MLCILLKSKAGPTYGCKNRLVWPPTCSDTSILCNLIASRSINSDDFFTSDPFFYFLSIGSKISKKIDGNGSSTTLINHFWLVFLWVYLPFFGMFRGPKTPRRLSRRVRPSLRPRGDILLRNPRERNRNLIRSMAHTNDEPDQVN